MSLNCSEVQETSGRRGDSSNIATFSLVLLLLPRKLPKHQPSIPLCQRMLPLTFQSDRQIFLLHLFSLRKDLSWLSNLVISFDTTKQHSLNSAGWSMSIQFISWIGTETVDKVTVGFGRFGRGLTFAASSPVRTSWTLSIRISSDVSVTYLLIPFTMRCMVSK